MLPLSIIPDTASKALRTLAPRNVTRLEMSHGCCSVQTLTVKSLTLTSFSHPGPTYRCPFTDSFEGFQFNIRPFLGLHNRFPCTGVNCVLSVPASLSTCLNRVAVDGHVADRDCIQFYLVREPRFMIGVVTRATSNGTSSGRHSPSLEMSSWGT